MVTSVEFLPPKHLQGFINKIVFVETAGISFELRTLPRNYGAILFPIPDTGYFSMEIGLDKYVLSGDRVYFADIGDEPASIVFQGSTKNWVVMLQPHCSAALFGDELLNCMRDVKDECQEWEHIHDILRHTALSQSEQARFIFAMLRTKFKSIQVRPRLRNIISTISQAHGNVNIKQLASENNISERTLLR